MATPQNFVLTGCASGMGRHLTTVLLQYGHRVMATDINFEALEAHAAERCWPADRVVLRRLDVRDREAWERIIDETDSTFGSVDVAMNIAGYLNAGDAYDSPPEEVDRHIDINVKGVMYGTMAAARSMMQRRQGHIINIASIAGLVPCAGLAIYCASKFAVRAYSLAAAEELRPFGIAVTAVCPFSVNTPMFERQFANDRASMMFSSKVLSVEDIEYAILHKALRKKPLEVTIPAAKCWLAKFANAFPATAKFIAPFYEKVGRANQERLQHKE